MSIAAFYRQWVPFISEYSLVNQPTIRSEPVWIKGNVQPFKKGQVLDYTEYGTIVKNYKTLYTSKEPDYEIDLPEGYRKERDLFYHKGRWYACNSFEDFTTLGRAPKHIKWMGVALGDSDQKDYPQPIPFGELVSSFENVVRELEQLTPIVIEEII